MTELIACLSTGKGTWTHVARLINSEEWDKVFLITNEFGKRTFKPNEKTRFIMIDEDKGVDVLVKQIKEGIAKDIAGPQVAFNMVSGSGKEHMAALSAILKLGLAVRLVYMEENSLTEL